MLPAKDTAATPMAAGASNCSVHLDDADYAALRRKAADMQKSAVELTGELLRAVIRGDIYEAVLDDLLSWTNKHHFEINRGSRFRDACSTNSHMAGRDDLKSLPRQVFDERHQLEFFVPTPCLIDVSAHGALVTRVEEERFTRHNHGEGC